VTGLGTINPLGLSVHESFQKLVQKSSGLSTYRPIWPQDKDLASRQPLSASWPTAQVSPCWKPSSVGALPISGLCVHVTMFKEWRAWPRFVQLLMEASHEAMADAKLVDAEGCIDAHLQKEKVGCILGTGMGSLEDVCDTYAVIHSKVHGVAPCSCGHAAL
jgi:3-oxoacyl-(acyl-carrier-protein) synthase